MKTITRVNLLLLLGASARPMTAEELVGHLTGWTNDLAPAKLHRHKCFSRYLARTHTLLQGMQARGEVHYSGKDGWCLPALAAP